MSGPRSRLRSILSQLSGSSQEQKRQHHIHPLSPTFFLPRAAQIEPDAPAIHHTTANGKTLTRSYAAFADRARGLAYHLTKHGRRRVGVLAPNTPAFLEAIYGVVAAGAVLVPANYRLKEDDIAYIFGFAEVDVVIVDAEFEHLLGAFRDAHPSVPILVDVVRFLSLSYSFSSRRPALKVVAGTPRGEAAQKVFDPGNADLKRWWSGCGGVGHRCQRRGAERAVRRGRAGRADVRP